jgi:hypothetical protein
MMNGLFIIIIVLVVLWLINQHSRNFEPFESYEEKKVELSLCDLVTLFKKLIFSVMMKDKQQMHNLPMYLKEKVDELPMYLKEKMHELPADLKQQMHEKYVMDLEPKMSVENGNMNIINNVEPNDDDIYSNQSLFAHIDAL